MPDETNELAREEKDTSKTELEKRTLVASQKEEASESLRYPESEELRSEDRATPGTEQSRCCPETVNVVTNDDIADGTARNENLELGLGYFGLGLSQLEVPEADNLLEVIGQIDGQSARILLDTGCSTHVLSSRFAERHGIRTTSVRSRPVALAVSSAKVHLTHKTEPLNLKIGNTVIREPLYILPIPQFDAIVGMPFFKENEIDLTELDWGILKVNESKISVGSGQDDPEAETSTVERGGCVHRESIVY